MEIRFSFALLCFIIAITGMERKGYYAYERLQEYL